MLPILALLFIVLPIVELYLIVQVAQSIGALETVALLVGIAVLGIWVVRRQGLGLLSRMQAELNSGQVPTTTLLDGVLILVGGVLLVAPGFLTDVVGVLLLIPPTRVVLRDLLVRRYRRRVRSGVTRVGRFGRVIVVDGATISGPTGPASNNPASNNPASNNPASTSPGAIRSGPTTAEPTSSGRAGAGPNRFGASGPSENVVEVDVVEVDAVEVDPPAAPPRESPGS